MSAIRVEVVVAAPPAQVWRHLADIGDHVSWMADADSLRFVGERRSGVGTRFVCATRVGPLRTLDVMEVTEWREGEAIGVRHRGLVTGSGRFVLRPVSLGRSRLTWREDLRFPWWLGGPLGAAAARPVLRAVWRGNLDRFALRATGRAAAPVAGPPDAP